MSSAVRLLLVSTIVVCALAPPASAARIGLGQSPGVAIDAAGTAHIAYNAAYADGVGQPLMYCAWPRGAKGCTPRPIVSDGQSPRAQPALVNAGPAPGEVSIVSVRAGIQAVRSLDGGATFAAPAVIGGGKYFDGAFGPDGRMTLTFAGVGHVEFHERWLAGPPGNMAESQISHGDSTEAVAGYDGVRPVVVAGGAYPGFAVSSWNGTGDVYDSAQWSGPFQVGQANDFALASGPRGLWLAYADHRGGGANRIVARKFSGSRFGRAHRVPAGRLGLPNVINMGFAQDPTGRMVAVWFNSTQQRLEYAASRTGRRWTAPRVLIRGVDLPSDLRVALGPDGRGFAVWDENGGDDLNVARVSVRKLLRRR
jgi:hypothetical protein